MTLIARRVGDRCEFSRKKKKTKKNNLSRAAFYPFTAFPRLAPRTTSRPPSWILLYAGHISFTGARGPSVTILSRYLSFSLSFSRGNPDNSSRSSRASPFFLPPVSVPSSFVYYPSPSVYILVCACVRVCVFLSLSFLLDSLSRAVASSFSRASKYKYKTTCKRIMQEEKRVSPRIRLSLPSPLSPPPRWIAGPSLFGVAFVVGSSRVNGNALSPFPSLCASGRGNGSACEHTLGHASRVS